MSLEQFHLLLSPVLYCLVAIPDVRGVLVIGLEPYVDGRNCTSVFVLASTPYQPEVSYPVYRRGLRAFLDIGTFVIRVLLI